MAHDFDMNKNLISVLIPSFNHVNYLRDAIESVWRQKYPNIEMVIVDDASTDGSFDLLNILKKESPLAMHIHSNERNYGPSYSLAKAFELSRGDFISFLASDDIYISSRFEKQMSYFDDKNLMILFSNGIIMHNDGTFGGNVHGDNVKFLSKKSAADILTYLYTHTSPFFIQTALARRVLIEDCFDKNSIADDWVININIFNKLIKNGKYLFTDDIVFCYRQHSENIHKNIKRHIALQEQVIATYTPVHLKRKAKINIYRGIAASFLYKNPLKAIYYIAKSIAYFFIDKIYNLCNSYN